MSATEGIIPALETSHAVAYIASIVPQMNPSQIVILCLSGRGDKDVYTVSEALNVEL